MEGETLFGGKQGENEIRHAIDVSSVAMRLTNKRSVNQSMFQNPLLYITKRKRISEKHESLDSCHDLRTDRIS